MKPVASPTRPLGTCLLLVFGLTLAGCWPHLTAAAAAKRDLGGDRRSVFASTTVQPLTADRAVFGAEAEAVEGRDGRNIGRQLQTGPTNARTIGRTEEHSLDGSYRYEYLTDNGIHRQESSQQIGLERIVRGSYSYVGPDNQIYTVNYVADRNGYRAYGAHLPTQPDAVANIINQQPPQPQLPFAVIGSTTAAPPQPSSPAFQFVPTSTARPIYQRPTGRPQFASTSPSNLAAIFRPSTTLAPPAAFSVAPAFIAPGFGSTFGPTSTPFPPPVDFDNRNQLGAGGGGFGQVPISGSAGTSSFALVEVTSAATPFESGTVHITPPPPLQPQPAAQQFLVNRYPNGQFGSLQPAGFGAGFGNAFGGSGGAFGQQQQQQFGQQSQFGQPQPFGQQQFGQQQQQQPFFTTFGQQQQQQLLPFVQQFGQFNRDAFPSGRSADGSGSSAAPSVQPLNRNGGAGLDVSSLQPSAFDRVVRRG